MTMYIGLEPGSSARIAERRWLVSMSGPAVCDAVLHTRDRM